MKIKIKHLFNEIFIEGLSGMATGLFATLIVGTILTQVGSLIPGVIGEYLFVIGKVASSVTGAGIGVGVAIYDLKDGDVTEADVWGTVGAAAGVVSVLISGPVGWFFGGISVGVGLYSYYLDANSSDGNNGY